ncbi:hypothetical protein DSECCO2_653770 [anaerobic digester metagenome]
MTKEGDRIHEDTQNFLSMCEIKMPNVVDALERISEGEKGDDMREISCGMQDLMAILDLLKYESVRIFTEVDYHINFEETED